MQRRLLLTRAMAALGSCALPAVRAQTLAGPAVRLESLQASRADDGLRLAYSARIELPRAIDEALHQGIPLHFAARAQVQRERWYWRDVILAASQRRWRLSYQALTRQYRVSTGGLQQSHEQLAEALGSIRRNSGWLLELREEPELARDYNLLFELGLDLTQLPGPLQIGLGPGASLGVRVERGMSPAELGLAT